MVILVDPQIVVISYMSMTTGVIKRSWATFACVAGVRMKSQTYANISNVYYSVSSVPKNQSTYNNSSVLLTEL